MIRSNREVFRCTVILILMLRMLLSNGMNTKRGIRTVKMSFDELNTDLSSEELKELEEAAARTIV